MSSMVSTTAAASETRRKSVALHSAETRSRLASTHSSNGPTCCGTSAQRVVRSLVQALRKAARRSRASPMRASSDWHGLEISSWCWLRHPSIRPPPGSIAGQNCSRSARQAWPNSRMTLRAVASSASSLARQASPRAASFWRRQVRTAPLVGAVPEQRRFTSSRQGSAARAGETPATQSRRAASRLTGPPRRPPSPCPCGRRARAPRGPSRSDRRRPSRRSRWPRRGRRSCPCTR